MKATPLSPDDFGAMPVHPGPLPEAATPPAPLRRMLSRPRRGGIMTIVAFVSVFGAWGAVAPLAGGAVAPGTVVPASGVKTVRHLDGGLVRHLHVSEGDVVTPGMPLATFSDVRGRADVAALEDRRRALLAQAARLDAERLGHSVPDFSEELDPSGPVVGAEANAFETRQALHRTQRRVLLRRVDQIRAQAKGFEAQRAAAAEQLALAEQELEILAVLRDRGLATEDRVLALRRLAADARGQTGEYTAEIAAAHQRIGETELELAAIDARRAETAALRAAEVRGQLAEVEETLRTARDVLGRAILRAPAAGVVSELRVPDVGGVVGPGEAVLDLVPNGDILIVEARVSPLDIDVVRVGLRAEVRLPAYPGRTAPRFEGTVTDVSPDAIHDPTMGSIHYVTRVSVPPNTLPENIDLVPGMPAEVLIVVEERTLLDYLAGPLVDILARALHEV